MARRMRSTGFALRFADDSAMPGAPAASCALLCGTQRLCHMAFPAWKGTGSETEAARLEHTVLAVKLRWGAACRLPPELTDDNLIDDAIMHLQAPARNTGDRLHACCRIHRAHLQGPSCGAPPFEVNRQTLSHLNGVVRREVRPSRMPTFESAALDTIASLRNASAPSCAAGCSSKSRSHATNLSTCTQTRV